MSISSNRRSDHRVVGLLKELDLPHQTMMPTPAGRMLKPPSVPRLSEPCGTQPAYLVCVIVCESECERRRMLALSVACSAAVVVVVVT